jgi:crossover junction endodeoxyribonuclease RusA
MHSITLRFEQRPWTANWARGKGHWVEVARRTAEWRTAWCALGHAHVGRQLRASRVVVTPYLPNRRGQQDTGGCFPAAKAAIDGLVDAGVWPDDTAEWVTELTFRPPVYGMGEALEIEIVPALSATLLTR